MKFILSVLVTLLIGMPLCFSQGFVNLNFESARIIPLAGGIYPYGDIATTNALPGWVVYYGANQQSEITFNAPALGSTFVTLYATNGFQLSGNYSVLLQGGGTATAASITQTGSVPSSAESLRFIASGAAPFPNTPILTVSLGGHNLPFFALSAPVNAPFS